jgi:L,D-transpeptidase ErfK/SrfK
VRFIISWVLSLCVLCGLTSTGLFAATYSLPPDNGAVIGKLQYDTIDPQSKLLDIQQNFDVGYNALEDANPHLDFSRPLPSESTLVIPTKHLLPNVPRTGIVINLPEMRLYYYPENSNEVLTYPIGIGKIGKTIPIKETKISKKVKDPVWVPTEDIRKFNLANGIELPPVMQAGPDNPLGPYAIYTGIPTYLIHSTIYPESIGKRASFGCIRMYAADIEPFFLEVKKGMSLTIINAPAKAGWQGNQLFLEVHHPLEEHHDHQNGADLPSMVKLIDQEASVSPTFVNWQLVAFINQERDGLPHEVGVKIASY